MESKDALVVRTDLKAGQTEGYGPGYAPPGNYGWWWLSNGYIAKPGRPAKVFAGWYYGPSPQFYYPTSSYGGDSGVYSSGGAEAAPSGGVGMVAPPAP